MSVLMRCLFPSFLLCALLQNAFAATQEFLNMVQDDQPLLWYQMNEADGNAINHGTLGASHDGMLQGSVGRQIATIAGDTGIAFDSANDYLQSLGTSSLTGNPTFSTEALVFFPRNGTAQGWGPLLHWGTGGTGKEVYFSVQQNNLNRIYAGFYNAGLRVAQPVSLGQWLHVVWTRQGNGDSATGTTLFVNGQSVNLEQDPNLIPGFLNAAQIAVTSSAFRINRAQDLIGSRFFTGVLDEIALYDRVLAANEVQQHFETLLQPCDFDQDLACYLSDIDALLAQGPIASGVAVVPGTNDQFDLTDDGTINLDDVDAWLELAGPVMGFSGGFIAGDVNLDGVVDGSDFGIWNANKFTSTLTWSQGNVNGDAVVDGSDFGIWNANKFTSSGFLNAGDAKSGDSEVAVTPVPEPTSMLLFMLGLWALRQFKS